MKASAARLFSNIQENKQEGRRMASFSLLTLCLLSLTPTATRLQSSDHLMMFASQGDSITLSCGIPASEPCSSINWTMAGDIRSVVVTAGRVTAPNVLRLVLLKDCSLQINHLELNDARVYTCESGALNSSVSLQVLDLVERPDPPGGKIELHCFLNTYKGYKGHNHCNNRGIHISWSTEDNAPLTGNRFHFEHPSECFSKLIINEKLTDHHRKWKCQLFQNDTVKATISNTTTVKDGIEEVFAAVGESVSLSCSDTSSLSVGRGVGWTVGARTDDVKGPTDSFHMNKDSSLVIGKVSALHAGDYQCLVSTGLQQNQTNKIRLHTLDVTSESGPGGDNLTLTCVLTCAKECEKDSYNLSWSGSGQNSWQSGLMKENNTLIKRLFLPVSSLTSNELMCLVRREGEVMASKRWFTSNSLQTLVWLALPLGLLVCTAAGGLCVYKKRKHKEDSGNEQTVIGMTHVYEAIQDEELHQQRQSKQEAAATDDFYHLLQPVK